MDTQTTSFFTEGQVWWCSHEAGLDFQRPILVLKKLSRDKCIGIPLSKDTKIGSWFTQITLQKKGERCALLYQIGMFHAGHFGTRMDSIDEESLLHVKEKLERLLGFS